MKKFALPVFVVALCLGAIVRAEDKKSDADKMQGSWQTVKAEIGGVALPDEIVNNLKYEITGNKMLTKGVPEIVKQYGAASFKLDPTTMPRSIDFTVTMGDTKGDELEAIYEFKGDDELRICVQIVGKERPGAFATKEGESRGLLVLKREKK